MSVKKKCNVILLKGSNIWKSMGYPENMMTTEGEWFTNGKQIGRCINDRVNLQEYFLHITSDDEIKEDDWYIKNNSSVVQSAMGEIQIGDYKNCKKIIATTDSLLIKEGRNIVNFLPKLSSHFIKKFIEEYNKGNNITEVMVEYKTELEEVYSHSGNIIHEESESFLNVNSANQITINKVKDNWTREEVIELCASAFITGTRLNDITFDQWIKENL